MSAISVTTDPSLYKTQFWQLLYDIKTGICQFVNVAWWHIGSSHSGGKQAAFRLAVQNKMRMWNRLFARTSDFQTAEWLHGITNAFWIMHTYLQHGIWLLKCSRLMKWKFWLCYSTYSGESKFSKKKKDQKKSPTLSKCKYLTSTSTNTLSVTVILLWYSSPSNSMPVYHFLVFRDAWLR